MVNSLLAFTEKRKTQLAEVKYSTNTSKTSGPWWAHFCVMALLGCLTPPRAGQAWLGSPSVEQTSHPRSQFNQIMEMFVYFGKQGLHESGRCLNLLETSVLMHTWVFPEISKRAAS